MSLSLVLLRVLFRGTQVLGEFTEAFPFGCGGDEGGEVGEAIAVIPDIGDSDGEGEEAGIKEAFVVWAVSNGQDLFWGEVGEALLNDFLEAAGFVLERWFDMALDTAIGEVPSGLLATFP